MQQQGLIARTVTKEGENQRLDIAVENSMKILKESFGKVLVGR